MTAGILTAVITSIIAAIAAVIVGIITAITARRSSREANEIDRFEALIAALDKRVDSLERELESVKKALDAEQRGHADTRGLFHVATALVRQWMSWADGDRTTTPPTVPPGLDKWI